MQIGALGKATGVDIETIRYYEKTGLLPAPARGRNGYRDYAEIIWSGCPSSVTAVHWTSLSRIFSACWISCHIRRQTVAISICLSMPSWHVYRPDWKACGLWNSN